jgi:hypothetical protein
MGRSLAPVISSAAQIKPMMAHAAAANRVARMAIGAVTSPSAVKASSAMAMGTCTGAGVGRTAIGVSAALPSCCRSCRNRRAFSAGLPELPALSSDTEGTVIGSAVIVGLADRVSVRPPMPTTRSIPLIAIESRSPTRTVKNTRKKQARADANAATPAQGRARSTIVPLVPITTLPVGKSAV